MRMKTKKPLSNKDKILIEKIIEDATTDCNDECEQISGWVCVLEENIPTPCRCVIGKENAVLEKIGQDESSNFILGLIKLGRTKLKTPIQDVFLEDSNLMKYIDAYAYWRENE